MKRISLIILSLLFFATAFLSDKLLSSGWVQQTIPRQDLPVRDLQFLDTLTGFIVSTKPAVDTAFVFKTTDGGNNWSTTFFESLYLVCMNFVDKNVGYCGGATVGSGILKKTTNGGVNWFTVSSIPSIIIEDVKFVNKDTGWVCSTASFTGGLWRTTNGGLSWNMQMNSSSQPSKIFFVNSNTGWFIGSANYDLYKTTNSGVNWSLQTHISNLSDLFFTSIDTGWAIGGGNGIVRTTNGGDNWYAVNVPVIPFETRLCFITNKTGWGGSGLHKIYVTKDGYNWGTQYSPSNRSDNICFVDSLHGWAGYTGLVHTTDGGGPITYTGIKQNGDFIPSFELGQNYPNPFNASTRIKFSILKSCYLDLKIFNIKGQEVANLISGLGYKPGDYEFYFDAGKYSISSGVYFYLMKGATTDNKEIFLDTKRMLMIK